MNDQLTNKIDSLLKKAEEQKNKTIAASRTISFIYILIAAIVVFYTSWLQYKIRKTVTKENISATVKAMVLQKLSDIPVMLDDLVQKQAEPLADHFIFAIHEQIPTVENIAKELINDYSGALIAQAKRDLFPQFHNILRENLDEIKVAAETLTDENATKELAKIIVTKITEEIDYSHGIIAVEANQKIKEITEHFKKLLEKPRNQLTNKEAAQRRLIVNWLYLIDREQGLDKIFRTMIHRFGYTWEYLLQEFGIKEAIEQSLSAIPEQQ